MVKMNEIVVNEKKHISFTEEIKKIRTNIKFSSVNEDKKIIVITSCNPSEGKSYVSANLATAFAMNNEKILLIDCDLRKGRQKKIFLVKNDRTSGLSNLLLNKNWRKEYPNYIQTTKTPNLYVIPTGPYPPNPSELLASPRFKHFLNEIEKEFDYIFLDCPPIVGLNDTLVVASIADTTILVAKHKKTQLDVLENSKKALEAVGANISGVIINQIEKKEQSYYYNHYYSYDNKYYQ